LISSAIGSLISKEGDQDAISGPELEQQLHCLRRLVASKAGFGCFTTLPGFREKVGWKVAKALKRCDDGISHAAIDMLCALMEPMHQDYDLRQEQLNKSSLLRWEALILSMLGSLIRIRRIPMFLGLSDPDPLVRDMDPSPDLSLFS
jgi:DnaJ family protein C protein 13